MSKVDQSEIFEYIKSLEQKRLEEEAKEQEPSTFNLKDLITSPCKKEDCRFCVGQKDMFFVIPHDLKAHDVIPLLMKYGNEQEDLYKMMIQLCSEIIKPSLPRAAWVDMIDDHPSVIGGLSTMIGELTNGVTGTEVELKNES